MAHSEWTDPSLREPLSKCRRIGEGTRVLKDLLGEPEQMASSKTAIGVLDLLARNQLAIQGLGRRAVLSDTDKYVRLVDRQRRSLMFEEQVCTLGKRSLDVLTALGTSKPRRLETLGQDMSFRGPSKLAHEALTCGYVTISHDYFQRTGLGDAVLRHANRIAMEGSKRTLDEAKASMECAWASDLPLPAPVDLQLVRDDTVKGVYVHSAVASCLDGTAYRMRRTGDLAWTFVESSRSEHRLVLKNCSLLLIRGFSQFAGQAVTIGEMAEQLDTALRPLERLNADTSPLRKKLRRLKMSSSQTDVVLEARS